MRENQLPKSRITLKCNRDREPEANAEMCHSNTDKDVLYHTALPDKAITALSPNINCLIIIL